MLLDRVRYLLKSAYYKGMEQQQGLEDAPVERGRAHKRGRLYFYNPAFDRSKRLVVFISGVVLVAVFLFSAGKLIGYGLDCGEYYRNLPYIGVLKPELYSK